MALCFAWTILGEDHNSPEHVAAVVEVVETHLIQDSPLFEWVVCGFRGGFEPPDGIPLFSIWISAPRRTFLLARRLANAVIVGRDYEFLPRHLVHDWDSL